MKKLMYSFEAFVLIVSILLFQPLVYANSVLGKELGEFEYINNCAVCHGSDGKGDGPMAGQLIKSPSNLTLLSKNNGGPFPETAIYQLIDGRQVVVTEEGRAVETFHGPKDMPVWGDTFRSIEGDEGAVDELISNLLKYLESIQVK